MSWIPTVTLGLLAAVTLGLLARRMGLSPIVGYLAAGILVGPHTPGFVANQSLASQLADVGVILLMFGVGLNFSVRDLLAVRSVAIPGALVASGVAVTFGTALGLANDWGLAASAIFGLCLATASTVVIVRGLIEMELLDSAAGRIVVGWSVVEDLITVVILVLLPALAGQGASRSVSDALLETAGTMALLGLVVVLGGSIVVPRLLEVVARARSRELFTLAVLVLALGVAFLSAELFGVSIALGAFLGGMVVGQSDLSHQAAADALPMRDAFAVLFFVAVGMLVDPTFVAQRPGLVAASLAIVLVLKPFAGMVVLLTKGYPVGASLPVAAGISQVSEFSFVLAGLAVTQGILPQEAHSVILATALLSIIASPALFRGTGTLERALMRNKTVVRFVLRRAGKLTKLPLERAEGLRDHAVLCGYGRVGSVLAAFLEKRGVPYVVIEQDRLTVETLRKRGVAALYGDAGSPMLLDQARIATAKVLVVSVPDAITARLALGHAQSTNERIESVIRIHRESERVTFHNKPRTQHIHGEQELAYAMARVMLQRFGVSAIESESSIIDARRAHGVVMDTRTRLQEIEVPRRSPLVGRTIASLELPRGVLVVTIARGGEFVVPAGDTTVEAGDALLVLADPERARAIEQLVTG